MRKIPLLLFIVFAALMPSSIAAYDFESNGIYYNIEGNEASVTYRDESYNSYSGSIYIPLTVTHDGTTYSITSIGQCAFESCKSLSSVSMRQSVTSIGNYAFRNCTSLTSVNIGVSVTSIGEQAFNYCTNLRSISIPNSVISIDFAAFSECLELVSVTFGNSLTTIGKDVFSYCPSLKSVNIPKSVTFIDQGAFRGCKSLSTIVVDSENTVYDSRNNCNAIIKTSSNTLISGCKNTVIPNSVTKIGDWAFQSCTSLTNIEIPISVTSIGEYAFDTCKGLTNVEIPNSVTSIGSYAFGWCDGLTSIFIPSSLTSIGNNAFTHCNGLTTMAVESGNAVYDSRDNCNAIIKTSSNMLLYGCQNTIIPNTVTDIGNSAFFFCRGLTSIEIPASVYSIGQQAFTGCSSLTKVICQPVSPPRFYVSNSFPYQQAPLFVPAEALESYQTHAEWGKFTRIVPFIGAGPGDVNGDGNIAISDVTNLIDQLLSGEVLPAWADVNGDGAVNISDVTGLIDILLNGGN